MEWIWSLILHLHIYMPVHVCVYICIYIHIYTHIHTICVYIHIYTLLVEVEVSEKDCTSCGQSLSLVFISNILSFGRVESFIAAGPRTGASQTWSSIWICGTSGSITDSIYVGKHSVHDPYDPSSGTQ